MGKKTKAPSLADTIAFIDMLELEQQEGEAFIQQMRIEAESDVTLQNGAVWKRAKKGCE